MSNEQAEKIKAILEKFATWSLQVSQRIDDIPRGVRLAAAGIAAEACRAVDSLSSPQGGSEPVEPSDFQLECLFDAVHQHGEFGRGFREDARRILAAAPAQGAEPAPLLRAGEWQPIETAPRDRHVIVWPSTFEGSVSCARWDADEYAKKPRPYWRRTDTYGRTTMSRDNPPTHWMPRPAPPSGAKTPADAGGEKG